MAEDVQSGAVLPAYCLFSAFSAARVMKRPVPGRKDVQSGAPSNVRYRGVCRRGRCQAGLCRPKWGLDRPELDYWPAG